MSKKDFVLIFVVCILLIPTGTIAVNYLVNHFAVLEAEGVTAASVSTAYIASKTQPEVKPEPTPKPDVQTQCTRCKGTKKVRSGDGLMLVPCECGENCQCKPSREEVHNGIRLMYFGATWCLPCTKMHDTTFKALKDNGWIIGDGGHIELHDIQEELELAKFYKISLIPCIIRLENDVETNRYFDYVNAGAFSKIWNGKELALEDKLYFEYK